MKSIRRPPRPVPVLTPEEEAYLSWITDSEKFTIEAALAMYAPGRTVPLTPAERAEIAGADLAPLLRAGIEIGLADYPERDKILKSLNETPGAAEGSPSARNRGNDDKET